jgi:inosine-uridine nucleoside N-ribohydrolase
MVQPIILDCDPGHDDAIAIVLALASPELDVKAITSSAGNQTPEKLCIMCCACLLCSSVVISRWRAAPSSL